MRVDHGGFQVLVAEQFLDGSDFITVFKHRCGKRVTEGVTDCAQRLRLRGGADPLLDTLAASIDWGGWSTLATAVNVRPQSLR